LQYLLKLDSLGFTLPLNPRCDLTYDQKIEALCRLRTLPENTPNTPTLLDLGVTSALVSNCQFAKGVFARGGPTLDLTRRLDIYQLPSYNSDTIYEHWQHSDLGVNAHDFRIDPDLDLLVLLETDPSPGDVETDLVLRFHLRSLRTGGSHPLATALVITSTYKFNSSFAPASFQIAGKYLALLHHTNQLLDPASPRISIWNWITGDLVTVSRVGIDATCLLSSEQYADVPGRYFAFVSDSSFVIHYDRRKWAETNIIGSLEVYTFDPKGPPHRARHVASLHLPPTTEGPCHSSSHFVFTLSAPISIPMDVQSAAPPRIYELSPEAHIICFKIRVFNIEYYPSEMANGTLFIPASSILKTISRIPSNGSQVHMAWDDWAKGTSWINNRTTHGEKDFVFGQRAAFLRYNANIHAWEIPLYDLRPSARPRVEDPKASMPRRRSGADMYIDNVFMDGGCGACEPDMISLITIPRDIISGNARAIDNPPEIMVDDEHGEVLVALAYDSG
jgi:hypothetical protein